MPSTVSPAVHRPGPECREISASSDRLPPSPLLSARIMIATYLTVTISSMVQNTMLMTPWTRSASTGSVWCPAKVSCSA